MNTRIRAKNILRILKKTYPDACCQLVYKKPWQLLIATILSAQCTDKRVNIVTKDLFKKYPSIKAFSKASLTELGRDIRSVGFYRNKAKSIIGSCAMLVQKYNEKLPRTMEEMITLPGVGRKTANVVLGNALGIVSGIAVDTHVLRLSNRVGFTRHADPEKIEQDLMKLFPKNEWIMLPHYLIAHGRALCKAPRPLCSVCPLAELCPSRKLYI